ncbi:MAG TPA: hypothetical protein DEA08_20635 [Planctomycetes bacterium]|nr:hypothetical protein [Planctomycetota bacterium]
MLSLLSSQVTQAGPVRLALSPPSRTDSTRDLIEEAEADAPLDPRTIALDYTNVQQPAWDFLQGETPLDAAFRPTAPWIDLTSRLLRAQARFEPAPTSAVALASRIRATQWGVVEEGNVLGRLRRWQRKLVLRVGSFSRSQQGQVDRWDGLGNPELEGDTGRTFALADDNLHGDVMLMVGRVENSTTLAEVMDGGASVLALNPFREVGVQFDMTLVEGVLPGKAVLVMRTRAAYLGFLEQVGGIGESAGASVDSELGVALALKW